METSIEFKKKFEHIVLNYLENKNLNFNLVETNDKKIIININNIKLQDAFNMGANIQMQLVDGEFIN